MTRVSLGISEFLQKDINQLKGQRLGLLTHAAAVDASGTTTAEIFLREKSLNLTTLYAPQQGFHGEDQDNMVETGHALWRGIPLWSLYSETRKPTPQMLENVDTVVIDLPEVGTRIYTFISTMALMMQACAESGRRVVVLDRPNPINGQDVQGITLESGCESFVGIFPMPTRHGMTIGELAQWMNEEMKLGIQKKCSLKVIPMQGWSRAQFFEETGHFFVLPSANMPTPETALTFPGTVYFEGTSISEGRGTTRPLEQVAAPYMDPQRVIAHLLNAFPQSQNGCFLRETAFKPTFQKYKGEVCRGIFIHPTKRRAFNPCVTGLALMRAIYEIHTKEFSWKQPPYEYEHTRFPIDVISGTSYVREWVEGRHPWDGLIDREKEDVKAFLKERAPFLLYKAA